MKELGGLSTIQDALPFPRKRLPLLGEGLADSLSARQLVLLLFVGVSSAGEKERWCQEGSVRPEGNLIQQLAASVLAWSMSMWFQAA